MMFSAVKLAQLLRTIAQLLCFRLTKKPQSSVLQSVVIGSNYGDRPDPNASALQSYFVNLGFEVIYCANEDSKAHVAQGARFTVRGSLYALNAMASAKAIFYTHSLSDVLPQGHKCPQLVRSSLRCPMVFLQHGVVGLKSRLGNGSTMAEYFQSLEPTFDFIVVSSNIEASIVNKLGIPVSKILNTGLPRFDHRASTYQAKQILVFFSWSHDRSLVRKYGEVLEPGFISSLNDRGYSLTSSLHDMTNFRLNDITPNVNFEDLIHHAQILITDDSSVAWDFFLSSREVIFYKPQPWIREDTFLAARIAQTRTDILRLLDEMEMNTLPAPFISDFKAEGCCEALAKKLDLV